MSHFKPHCGHYHRSMTLVKTLLVKRHYVMTTKTVNQKSTMIKHAGIQRAAPEKTCMHGFPAIRKIRITSQNRPE